MQIEDTSRIGTCQRSGCTNTFFIKSPSRPQRFCSTECKHLWQHKRVRRNCIGCGVVFEVPASMQLWNAADYHDRTCYDTFRERGALSPEAFFRRVDTSQEGCWEWRATRDAAGYGLWGANHHRNRDMAHRRAWELASGKPIPPGMVIGHICDNPPCVRNDDNGTYIVRGKALPRYGHLFMGTTADNMADKTDKGRNRNAQGRRYPRAHELSVYFDQIIPGVRMPIAVFEEIRLLPGTLTPAPNKYTFSKP